MCSENKLTFPIIFKFIECLCVCIQSPQVSILRNLPMLQLQLQIELDLKHPDKKWTSTSVWSFLQPLISFFLVLPSS